MSALASYLLFSVNCIAEMGKLYSGVLKVRVVKGSDLVIRDLTLSSDPYVVIKLGKQKQQTRVIKKSLNPSWNEDLKFNIMNISQSDGCLFTVEVWDKDYFTRDDFMGVAEVDLKPLLQEFSPMANGKKVVAKSRKNCLDKDSYIVAQKDGRIVQEVCLKLGRVLSGLLYLTLEWQPGL